MRVRGGYAIVAGLVLLVEIAIALFVRDRWVRPYGGDALAVVLVYLALRAVTPWRTRTAVVAALAVAIMVEFSQLFGLVDALGLRHSATARAVLGTGFDWHDFVAYAVGGAAVLCLEQWRTPAA